MIKRLLLSAVAATAMAFSASADTLDMLPSIGNGWEASYDAATKTITFEGAWKGYGWWLDGADYSKYDEMVVEFVENAQTVQIVIEYGENDNESVQAASGKTKLVAPLNPEKKNSIRQIYLQLPEAGTLTLTAAYMQNAVEVDPTQPVVLFEKETALTWSGKIEIACADFAAAKTAAGDKLVVDYVSEEGNGFKVLWVDKPNDWAWTVMPFMTKLEGYSEQYGTIYLPTESNTISFDLDQENVDLLVNKSGNVGSILLQGDKVTVKKVSIVHAGAGAGIDDIAADNADAPVEFFNLQGVRVANPAAGNIYIRRQGNNVSKVLVK